MRLGGFVMSRKKSASRNPPAPSPPLPTPRRVERLVRRVYRSGGRGWSGCSRGRLGSFIRRNMYIYIYINVFENKKRKKTFRPFDTARTRHPILVRGDTQKIKYVSPRAPRNIPRTRAGGARVAL